MKTTRLIFIFLLLLPAALGADFTAFSDNQDIYACACSTVTDNIYVKNTQSGGELVTYTIGNETSGEESDPIAPYQAFQLYQEGGAAGWATLFPSDFVLESQKTHEVNSFLNIPCSAEGTYDLETYIKGETTQKLNQQVYVRRCDNIAFSMPDSVETCPCELQVLELELENTGTFPDVYSLSFAFPDNFRISVSEKRFILEPGESKTVYVYVDSDCATWGEFEIETIVSAENNMVEKTKTLPVTIEPCYDSQVRFGEMQDSENETFTAYQGIYNICEGREKLIPFEIKNQAAFANDFSFDSPGIVYERVENLAPNATFTNYLRYDAEKYDNGWHNMTLSVTAIKGDITETYALPVFVDWCYTPQFQSRSYIEIPFNTSVISLNMTNWGMDLATYALDVQAPGWVKLTEEENGTYYEVNSVTLIPEQKKELYLLSSPINVSEGEYDVNITATAGGVAYSHNLMLELSTPGWFANALAFLAGYALYILLALLVLIIILFLLTRSKGRSREQVTSVTAEKTAKKTAKKTGKKKAKKEAKKEAGDEKRSWWWLIIPLLLLLLIILAIADAPFMMQWIPPIFVPQANQTVETDNQTVETDNQTVETDNQTVETDNQTVETDNQTVETDNQTVETDNETMNETGFLDGIDDFLEPEPENVTNCTFYVQQGEVLEFNLSEAFVDPDGDQLYYNYTVAPDNMNVTFEDEMVYIKPEPSFEGVEYIEFTADDRKGGQISSGLLSICSGEENSYLDSLMDMISLYKYYILVGFLFLGLLIIVMHHFERKG